MSLGELGEGGGGRNRLYLVNHDYSHPDSLHISSLNKYSFEYLFGACLLFVMANISPQSLHSLLMVSRMKPSRGGGVRLKRRHPSSILMLKRERNFSKSPPPGGDG